MTRRWWTLGLFAPQAVGQETVQPDMRFRDAILKLIYDAIREVRISRPANGECPRCGIVALPYVRDVSGMTGCVPCTGAEVCATVCRPWTIEDLPKSRMVRCANCSNSFWQDAEVAR